MIRAFGVADVRAAEAVRLAQVPEGALMQRAASGLAATCLLLLRERRGRVSGARALLLVGAGNNGGDALWAGQRLAARGVQVVAVTLSASVHSEGLAALRSAGGRVRTAPRPGDGWPDATDPAGPALAGPVPGGPVRGGRASGDPVLTDADLTGTDLIIDGIVGLGGAPGLREPAAGLVARLLGDGGTGGAAEVRRPLVVAVDLPSGVDPDEGSTPAPHVRADVTVTFGAAKPCLLLPPASRAAGRVIEVDIGLRDLLPAAAAVERLEAADVAARWPVPGPGSDKYRRGVVGVVAGSAAYTGAAVLACGGALRAGAGMVRYVGPGPAA
ncbi:MAG TPA: NAD(P)H-hydrate epimerase, partial [Kineosporiaceae bacterium]|nr:NAD(P)H-hydrate epimerase [Kineosporiaceae bacterium]